MRLQRIGLNGLRPGRYSNVVRYYASNTSGAPIHDGTAGDNTTTQFGYKTVPTLEKEGLVGKVFANVATKYDVMNDAMSMGIHRLWKDRFVASLNPGTSLLNSSSSPAESSGMNIIDLAGGTGDIAFRMLEHAQSKHGDYKTKVKVIDINAAMLQEGKKRQEESAFKDSERLEFEEGNAEHLDSIPSNSIDIYTIAFGIRNCTSPSNVIKEAYRVLKPGGIFACLEFCPNTNIMPGLYKWYSFRMIPLMGELMVGDRDSYQYFVESIDRFPAQPVFEKMISDQGFEIDGWEDLSFGIAAIHKGVKPV